MISIEDKRKYIKNALILLLVIIFCSMSSFIYLQQERTVEYSIPRNNAINVVEIKAGDVFEQNIKIQGFIDRLCLLVATGGGNRAETNTGSITFLLQQGTIEEDTILNINGIEDWTYVEIPINLSDFTTGEATLTIKGIDTQIGSSIFLIYQGENIYELPPLKCNGESLSGALVLKYQTQNFGNSFKNFVLFFSLSVLLCLVLAKFTSSNKNNAAIYALTCALIFCLIALRYPSYTVAGEAVAEVGNVYVPSALSQSFMGNLMVLEADLYINLLSRLTVWFLVHIIPSLYWVVFSINVFSLILVSVMGASISSGVFKKYISPLESVVLSILITACMVDAGTNATPMVTSYWGIIPLTIIFISFILKIEIPKWLMIIWTTLGVLCIFSRMSYVVLVPILVVYIVWYHKQLTKRQIVYTIVIVGLCLSEGVLSLILQHLKGTTTIGSIEIISPLQMLNDLFYYQVQMLHSILRFQPSNYMLVYNLLGLALLISIIVLMLYWIWKGTHKLFAKGVLLLLALSFGQNCLLLVTEGFSPAENGVDWNITINMPHNRHWMFCYLAYLIIIYLIYSYARFQFETARVNSSFCMAGYKLLVWYLVLMICSVQVALDFTIFYNLRDDIGDWKLYHTMMERDTFLVPFEPRGWYFSKNCEQQSGNTQITNQIDLSLEANQLVSMYVTRNPSTNQLEHRPYYITVYDMAGNEVIRNSQIGDLEENLVGFDLNIPLEGISKVTFTYEDGTNAYVEGLYLLGYQ